MRRVIRDVGFVKAENKMNKSIEERVLAHLLQYPLDDLWMQEAKRLWRDIAELDGYFPTRRRCWAGSIAVSSVMANCG
jgi:hypothetical protein